MARKLVLNRVSGCIVKTHNQGQPTPGESDWGRAVNILGGGDWGAVNTLGGGDCQ